MKKKVKKHTRHKIKEMKDRTVVFSPDDDIFKTTAEFMFEYVKKNDGVTVAQLAREFKTNETTVRRFLLFQLDAGTIVKEKCKCGMGNLYK